MEFWTTSTCAPESASVIKQNNKATLLRIVNEDNTRYVQFKFQCCIWYSSRTSWTMISFS